MKSDSRNLLLLIWTGPVGIVVVLIGWMAMAGSDKSRRWLKKRRRRRGLATTYCWCREGSFMPRESIESA